MARQIQGLDTLLNILAQNRAQKIGNERFDRQMAFQQDQAAQAQANWLEQLGMEQERLGIARGEASLNDEARKLRNDLTRLQIQAITDPENAPGVDEYRGIYTRLVQNADPSLIEGGLPAFDPKNPMASINAVAGAQRMAAPETPNLSSAMLNILDPITRVRDEWGEIDPVARQQYGSFDAYRQERLPELIGPYNFIAPMFGLEPIDLGGGGPTTPQSPENLNTPEWRQQASQRAQAITDEAISPSPLNRAASGYLGALDPFVGKYMNFIDSLVNTRK
jgi:hypothetical protein